MWSFVFDFAWVLGSGIVCGLCLAFSCVMLGVWSGRFFCGHDVWERFLSNSVISVCVFSLSVMFARLFSVDLIVSPVFRVTDAQL